ncbi:MAG: hypothetical protein JNK29_14700, partial [Anaerolineales bacterium]|nr:hypothetical protein [Anaerolineales bacterium]
MPPLTDPARIRAMLETDRNWAAYALGDLAPEHAPYCEWRATLPAATAGREPDAGAGRLLIYRRLGLPGRFTR